MHRILLENTRIGSSSCSLLIEGNRIARIVPSAQAEELSSGLPVDGLEIVDCGGKQVVPGWVNAHTHAAMSLMRGIGEDILFSDWIDRIWEVEKNIDSEYIYHATKVACLEMLKTGTTTFLDQYWDIDVTARAVGEMGMRAVLSHVFLDHMDPAILSRQKEEASEMYLKSLDWPETVQLAMAIHAIYSVSEEGMRFAADFARSHGMKIHLHLSETQKEVEDCFQLHGVSPVKYLDSLGILGADVIAAHTLWLSEEDISILAERKVNCVHNINSNLKLASGYRFLYNELKEAGVRMCMGTDGCASSNNLDMLEAMKTAAIVQKAWRGDPRAMPVGELFSMATLNGAEALGLDCGAVREGALADLLLVDTDNTFFLSNAPFLSNYIYSAHSDCVDSVICNGRFVMRGRKVEGEEEILDAARTVLDKIRQPSN